MFLSLPTQVHVQSKSSEHIFLNHKHNEGILGCNISRCCGYMDISPNKQQDRMNSTGKYCPDDWLQKQGKGYKFDISFKSWIDSEISCAVKKSHLLVIKDKGELVWTKEIRSVFIADAQLLFWVFLLRISFRVKFMMKCTFGLGEHYRPTGNMDLV